VTEEVDLRDLAVRHRQAVQGVVAIGVTGSCGKTTTTDLIAAVLSSRYRVSKSDGFWNCGLGIAHSLLSVRADDDFYVQELGAWGPGTLDAGIELVRPDVAVITNFRDDHYSSFRGARGAQAEKGKLLSAVEPSGTAVLNYDDALVRELDDRTTARTLCFGRHEKADLRAFDVTARWPERLAFSVTYRGQTRRVSTRLLGEHLLGSALAAIGVGLAFGLSLDDASSALEGVEPHVRRMSPVVAPDGITFIRDDYKAPADSIPEVLAFMAEAVAERKVGVFGRISDYPGRSRRCYSRVAREALAVLDVAIFVGQRATDLWGEQWSMAATDQVALRERLEPATGWWQVLPAVGDMLVFGTVRDASDFLAGFLRAGDLTLLKASGEADHLERVLLSRQQAVNCWLTSCGKKEACDVCSFLPVGGVSVCA
jgi:UDP-N-acetylmuramoyl-tripeptide--D-alanyl-D-alanine ligase